MKLNGLIINHKIVDVHRTYCTDCNISIFFHYKSSKFYGLEFCREICCFLKYQVSQQVLNRNFSKKKSLNVNQSVEAPRSEWPQRGRSAAPDCCPERYSSLETSKKLREFKKKIATTYSLLDFKIVFGVR